MTVFKRLTVLILILSLSLSSCSQIPIDAEDLGLSAGRALKDRFFKRDNWNDQDSWKALQDRGIDQYLNTITQKIVKSSPNPNLSIQTEALDTPFVQGFSSRAGDIYITRGMLNSIETEAELACLIGHEVEHQFQFASGEFDQDHSTPLADIANRIAPDEVLRLGLSDDLRDISYSKYSKERETQADEIGSEFCGKAGYDSFALSRLLNRLSIRVKDNLFVRIKKLKGTHEQLKARADHLRIYLSGKGYRENFAHQNKLAYQENTKSLQKHQTEFTQDQKNTLAEIRSYRSQIKNKMGLDEVVALTQKLSLIVQNQKLTPDDFLSIQRSHPGKSGHSFMEERVIQDSPFFTDFRSVLAESLVDTLSSLARVGVSFIPYVGAAIDLHDLVTGKDFFSGEDLSLSQRAMTAIGLTLGQGKLLRELTGELKGSQLFGEEVSASLREAGQVENGEKIAQEVRYGPMNEGELHKMPACKDCDYSAGETFRSSSYSEVVTTEPTKLYRVYGEEAGELSPYWSKVKPEGPLQATLDSALDPAFKNSAKNWVEITVPKGTSLYEGAVSPVILKENGLQVGNLYGGGNQVHMGNLKIDPNWITSRGKF